MLTSFLASPAYPLSLYQIGNSFTVDSQPNAIKGMALAAGLDWTGGFHIRTSSTINQIYQTPAANPSHQTSPGPTWVEGLVDLEWDAIVIQPHNQNGNTLASDINATLSFVSASMGAGNNSNAQWYVYETWPTEMQGWSNWLTPVLDLLTQPTIHRQQFYQHVANRLSDALEKPVYVIPAGDALYRVSQAFPELALYRDDLHLNNYGRLVASSAVFATVTGVSPVGLPTTQFTSGDPDTVLALQSIVWDVVSNHPYSGVVTTLGDYDGDGVIDQMDYKWWANSFGKINLSYAADGNRDGTINAADYVIWRDNYQGGTSGSVTVPEPGGLALASIALAAAGAFLARANRHLC